MVRIVSVIIPVLFVVSLLYYAQANHCCCEPCPKKNVITANLSDPQVLAATSLNLMEKSWNSSQPILTKKGERFKKIILHMIHSDVPLWQMTGGLATLWAWAFLPEIAAKPDFSGFAKITSASVVDPKSCGFCTTLNKAIDALLQTVTDMGTYVKQTALTNSGCITSKLPVVSPVSTSNYSASETYCDAKKLFRQVGCEYPCEFQKSTLELYRSCNYMDQMLGVISTAVMSNHLHVFFLNYNATIMFQAYQMMGTSKIPKHCCKYLLDDLKESLSFVPAANNNTAETTKRAAGCL